MAKKTTYFPAYHNFLQMMEPLTDSERGRLFTALLVYSSTGEATDLPGNEKYVFPAMRMTIDQSRGAYETACAKNKENALSRWSGNGDGENGENEYPYEKIIEYLNKMAGTGYRSTTQKTRTCIKARIDEGFSFDDFVVVINKKCRQWSKDEKMAKFLRPETLFGTKFEGYLNEKEVDKDVASTVGNSDWKMVGNYV